MAGRTGRRHDAPGPFRVLRTTGTKLWQASSLAQRDLGWQGSMKVSTYAGGLAARSGCVQGRTMQMKAARLLELTQPGHRGGPRAVVQKSAEIERLAVAQIAAIHVERLLGLET